jgi:Na+-driven multidrug efflux pump
MGKNRIYELLKFAGEGGIVSYGVLMQVGFVFNAIFIGYSIGTAPIVGYHYGAKNYDEIKNVFKKSIVINILAGMLMTILSVTLAIPLSKMFVGYNGGLVDLTANAMRIYAFSFVLYGFNIFTSSFFTALNNGLISAISSTCRTLLFQTLSVLLLPLLFGLNGIWFAIIVAEILAIGLNTILLLTNKKKYNY